MRAPSYHCVVTSTDIELNYEIAGPSDGFPVLFVHGILTCRAHWLLNLPAFHDAGYRSITVDLFGHGSSPAPDDEAAYHPDRYTDRFSALRELVGAERWFVVGQSLGAALTLSYAISCPDEVIAPRRHQLPLRLRRSVAHRQSRRRPRARPDDDRRRHRRGHEAPASTRAAPEPSATPNAPDFDDAMLLSTPTGIGPHDALHLAAHRAPPAPARQSRQHPAHRRRPAEEAFSPAREWVEANAANFRVERVSATHAVNISAADDFNRLALAFFAERFPPRLPIVLVPQSARAVVRSSRWKGNPASFPCC